MKTTLAHWLTILSPYRSWLLIMALLMLAGGWYLSWPSAPMAQWTQPEFVQALTMITPHTLAVTTRPQTSFYAYPYLEPTASITYHNPVDEGGLPNAQTLIAVSADGQWLAAATTVEPLHGTAASEGRIELWSVRDVRLVDQIPVDLTNPNQRFQSVTLSQDGQCVGWIVNGNGKPFSRVSRWYLNTQHVTSTRTFAATMQDPRAVSVLVNEPQTTILRSNNFIIQRHGLDDEHLLYSQDLLFEEYGKPSISSDERLMTMNGEGFVTVRQVSTGQLLQRLSSRKSRTLFDKNVWQTARVFSPDNRFLLVAASTSRTRGSLFVGIPDWSWAIKEPAVLWNLQTGQVVQRFDVQPDGATMLAYSPDGQYVATASGEEVRVFRVSPQPPYLQPALLLVGLMLLMLFALGWIWARRGAA